MDRLFRLTFAAFMLACIGLLIQPRLALAQQYEYTPKVLSTTGGVAKTTTTEYACSNFWGGTAYGQSCTAYYGWGPSAVNKASQVCSISSYAGPPAVYIGGVTYYCTYNGSPSATYWITMQTRSSQACPQDTYEGSDGLCYVKVCPTATPPWQADPADANQCRRLVNCPAPQVAGATGCECPTGKLWNVGPTGGIAEVTRWTAKIPATTAPSSYADTLCGRTGTNTAGCSVERDVATWNGSEVTLSGTILNGQKCTATSGDGTADPNAKKCPVGQVVGEINGSTVCVEGGTTETKEQPKTETTTKTNPDGTTEETTKTTECSTKCIGGNCEKLCTTTITTTFKDANGQTTGTETSTGTSTGPGGGGSGDGDGEGGGESSFGGACPSFACEGDAVVCAIAKEQHMRNCQFWESKGAFTTSNAESEFDTTRQFDKTQLNAPSQALGNITATTFLSGGCVQDAQFTVWGKAIAIPFSSLCPYLAAAGNVFLAVCGLMAFAVVRRGTEA